MQEKFENALKFRIIPVVAINDANDSDLLADALIEGGLPCAEITFRTEAAEDAIHRMSKRGDIFLGAGTVLNINQAKHAVEFGASFIVSPGFDSEIVRYCIENRIPVVPGISTPTDIQMAIAHGLRIVKFFPAEAFGGLKTLKAVSAPFPMIKFIPTGGIGPQNVVNYLTHPKVAACGGSWMVKSELISAKKFDEIAILTREAVKLAATAAEKRP